MDVVFRRRMREYGNSKKRLVISKTNCRQVIRIQVRNKCIYKNSRGKILDLKFCRGKF